MAAPTIRVATESDAAAIRDIYAPYVADTAITFETTAPSPGGLRERIRETRDEHPWLVCELDGDLVGYACAGPIREYGAYRWAVESTVYVADDAHGAGVGSALYDSLLSVLALQGFLDVHALVTRPNPASVALHESFGFERVTTFEAMGYKGGAWHDVDWWRRELGPRPDDPAPPLSASEVRELDGWEEALEAGEKRLKT